MRELKIGDKVDIIDGSYVFGIRNGRYTASCNHQNGDREGLTVVDTGLKTMKDYTDKTTGESCAVCDILVTNNEGNYWFTQSSLVELCKHTIVIDGKKIEISGKSFEALKRQFCG